MSQTDDIRYHLEHYGPLTALSAVKLYGCLRLAARILELKNEGMNISSTPMRLENGKVVAMYCLEKSDVPSTI